MKRDVLQVSIAAAIAGTVIRLPFSSLPDGTRAEYLKIAEAVLAELQRLNVLKGVK